MKKKNLVLILISIGIVIGFVLWMFLQYARHVEGFTKLKLADYVTNSTVTVHFHVPKGKYYRLFAAGGTIPSGHVNIRDGQSLIAKFSFNGGNGNLPIGGNGCELTDFRITATNQIIQAQKNYDLQIVFDRPPTHSSSIWLYWLQAYKDRDR